MKDFEQIHPSELQTGDEVLIENFESGQHKGQVESWHVTGDGAYKLELDSKIVYTVAENPGEFGDRKYVAEFTDVYTSNEEVVLECAYDAAAEVLGWEGSEEDKILAKSD